MVDFNDDSLLQEFVTESQEHLASIEPDLLVLEKEGESVDTEVVNRIFRAMHSIKGAAGFFGLTNLKETSHVMESVLMMVRDGSLKPSTPVVDALLMGVDKLNLMINDVKSSESVDCELEISRLEKILSGEMDETPSSEVSLASTSVDPTVVTLSDPRLNADYVLRIPSPLPFEPLREKVIEALSADKALLAVYAFLDTDLKNRTPLEFSAELKMHGQILDSAYDVEQFPGIEACLEKRIPILFLVATTVAPSVLAKSVNLPEDQVTTLDFMTVLEKEASTESVTPRVKKVVAQSKVTTTEAFKPEVLKPEKPAEPSAVVTKPQVAATGATANNNSPASTDHLETVRVKVELLNKLMNLAGEMVLLRNQLNRNLAGQVSKVDGLAAIMQNLDLTTSDLQEHIMQTRMQPIGNVFGKFPRVVRDLARQLGKEIELVISGEEVELDKSLIESLSDPLTHLIRNCCDHAIELPEVRTQAGKPRSGKVRLEAYHEGGQINIAIIDDGKGIDGEAVAQKAIENGAITKAEVDRLSLQEKINLIFLPGLSMAKEISDVSGRGVGMDVVRNNIEKLGGHIILESQLGQGTQIVLRLPLTLAIIPSLIVQSKDHRFAIPQVNLTELICVKAHEIPQKIERVGSATVLRLRGKLLPLVRLSQVLGMEEFYPSEPPQPVMKPGAKKAVNSAWLEVFPERRQSLVDERHISKTGVSTEDDEDRLSELLFDGIDPAICDTLMERRSQGQDDINIVVLKVGTQEYGLIVNEVLDLEEIVVKPLSSYLKNCKCFSGATIMGDGRVAMILDGGGISAQAKLTFTQKSLEENALLSSLEKTDLEGTEKREVILFNNAQDEVFAVSLPDVLRLERFNLSEIQSIGGREFITYQGKGLPLIRLENYLPVKPGYTEGDEAFLILPKVGQVDAGIIATNIIDVLTVNVKMQEAFGGYQSGVIGSAVVQDRLTVFIDPEGLMTLAGVQIQYDALSADKALLTIA